jgi:hypothetical protein
MTLDPDRRAALTAAKLAALVRGRWGQHLDHAERGGFPDGATLIDRADGRTWVLVGADGDRRLGAAMAVGARAGASELHVLTEVEAHAAVLARRASCFEPAPMVWWVDGTEVRRAEAAPPAVDASAPPAAEACRPALEAAGLDVVVEGGHLLGELRGLEVARVVVDDTGIARIEAGVGRFDREVGAMMFADLAELDALARAVDQVDAVRRPGIERHPLNQLVPERWLRHALVHRPDLVGAAWLRPVGSAVPRANLKDLGVASAVGVDLDGGPLVVTCSTGVDLELVPSAADDRLTHEPSARLVLALPARDAMPITTDLARHLAEPAEVVALAEGWQDEAGAPRSPDGAR